MTSKPYFHFFPVDYLGEPTLRAVSYAAKGLWIELLSIMHTYDGILPKIQETIIRNTICNANCNANCNAKKLGVHIDELETAKVFSRNDVGEIVSRRMIRDCERAGIYKENAESRWAKRKGNPKEKEETPTSNTNTTTTTITSGCNANCNAIASPPTPQGEAIDLNFFVNSWNAAFGEPTSLIRPINKLTEERKRKLRSRMASPDFKTNWLAVLDRMKTSDFLTGRSIKENDAQKWVASFDWLIRSDDIAVKIMEGAYDNKFKSPQQVREEEDARMQRGIAEAVKRRQAEAAQQAKFAETQKGDN